MFGVGQGDRFVGGNLRACQIFLGKVGSVIAGGVQGGARGPLACVFHEFFYKFIMEQRVKLISVGFFLIELVILGKLALYIAATLSRLQQIMNKYQQLHQLYYSLTKHSHTVNFHNSALRSRDHDGALERPFFGLAVILAADANITSHSYITMVTASHNPPGYNGVKVDAIFADLKLDENDVTDIINSPLKTMELVDRIVKGQQNKGAFYIGRDKRPTSFGLSSIIKSVLTILGREVVDLGERSTPETLSLSQFLYKGYQIGQNNVPVLIKDYFQIIEKAFKRAINIISQNTGRKWQRKSLCLDCSKGVGGQSLKYYGFLYELFDIKVINFQDFSHPNQKCGAEWLYKYFNDHETLPSLQNYPQTQQYYFFDGDSDRIIGKMGHESILIDGDDFNACFAVFLRQLLDEIHMEEQVICSVGNVTSNDAIERYMGKLSVIFKKVPVGIKYLWSQVKRQDIGCYFENSGHGCMFFSQNILQTLKKYSQEYWQAQLLLLLNELARNNSRGYALHNMLIFQLYLFYFKTNTGFLFEKSYILNRQYKLSRPELFINGAIGMRLLEKPSNLAAMVQKLQKMNSEQKIMLRKSAYSPVIRLTIQGKREKCNQILSQIQFQIQAILRQVQSE